MERFKTTVVLSGYSAGRKWPVKICSTPDSLRIMTWINQVRHFGRPVGIDTACGAPVITLSLCNAFPEDVVLGRTTPGELCKIFRAFWEIPQMEFSFIEMNGKSDELRYTSKGLFDYLYAILEA